MRLGTAIVILGLLALIIIAFGVWWFVVLE